MKKQQKNKKRKVAIVIPAYNEEKRIGNTLKIYSDFFKKVKDTEYEILVVINNTKDNTEKIVKSYSDKNKRIKYINLVKGGKGYAIVEGFALESKKDFDLIGFVDADSSTSPEAFHELVENINNYDGIIGNRWSKKAKITKRQTLLRQSASRIFNFIVKSLFFINYEDTQCGAKIFRKKVIEKIYDKIYITQWAFDVNLLYLCKVYGFKIREFPTVWEDKGDSKLHVIKSSLKMFFGILRLRLINSPFRYFIKLYDKMPESVKVNHRVIG